MIAIALPHLSAGVSLVLWIISGVSLGTFALVSLPTTARRIVVGVALALAIAAGTVYAVPIQCTGWECIPWLW